MKHGEIGFVNFSRSLGDARKAVQPCHYKVKPTTGNSLQKKALLIAFN
jgi:hypothetical protein